MRTSSVVQSETQYFRPPRVYGDKAHRPSVRIKPSRVPSPVRSTRTGSALLRPPVIHPKVYPSSPHQRQPQQSQLNKISVKYYSRMPDGLAPEQRNFLAWIEERQQHRLAIDNERWQAVSKASSEQAPSPKVYVSPPVARNYPQAPAHRAAPSRNPHEWPDRRPAPQQTVEHELAAQAWTFPFEVLHQPGRRRELPWFGPRSTGGLHTKRLPPSTAKLGSSVSNL
jgi:hypothetical protein